MPGLHSLVKERDAGSQRADALSARVAGDCTPSGQSKTRTLLRKIAANLLSRLSEISGITTPSSPTEEP